MSPSGRAHTNTAPDLSASNSSRASAGTSGAPSRSCKGGAGPRSGTATVGSNWTSGSPGDVIRATVILGHAVPRRDRPTWRPAGAHADGLLAARIPPRTARRQTRSRARHQQPVANKHKSALPLWRSGKPRVSLAAPRGFAGGMQQCGPTSNALTVWTTSGSLEPRGRGLRRDSRSSSGASAPMTPRYDCCIDVKQERAASPPIVVVFLGRGRLDLSAG